MWDQPYSVCHTHDPDTILQEALELCSWELRNSWKFKLVRFVLRFVQISHRDELVLNPKFKSPLDLQRIVLSHQAPFLHPLRYNLCIRKTLTHCTSVPLLFMCFLFNSFWISSDTQQRSWCSEWNMWTFLNTPHKAILSFSWPQPICLTAFVVTIMNQPGCQVQVMNKHWIESCCGRESKAAFVFSPALLSLGG